LEPNPKFLVVQPNHYTKQAAPDPGKKIRLDLTQTVTVLGVEVAVMVGCLCNLFDDAFFCLMVLVKNLHYTPKRLIYLNAGAIRTPKSNIMIIIIIFINCNWVVTRWQWLFYMYTEYEIGY